MNFRVALKRIAAWFRKNPSNHLCSIPLHPTGFEDITCKLVKGHSGQHFCPKKTLSLYWDDTHLEPRRKNFITRLGEL